MATERVDAGWRTGGRSGYVDPTTPNFVMFNNPTGLVVVTNGAGGGVDALLVADRNNGRLRGVNAVTGATSTSRPPIPLLLPSKVAVNPPGNPRFDGE